MKTAFTLPRRTKNRTVENTTVKNENQGRCTRAPEGGRTADNIITIAAGDVEGADVKSMAAALPEKAVTDLHHMLLATKENKFLEAEEDDVSTFSLDHDRAIDDEDMDVDDASTFSLEHNRGIEGDITNYSEEILASIR